MLDIEHGTVRRGTATVLERGRITAPAPAAVALIGINGSGKSSLFLHLIDALRGSRGGASISIGGRTASLAFVPQEPALPAWLDVRHVARLHDLDLDRLIERMPGLHLDELRRKRAGALSLGQRQAFAIALALGRNADLVLLDEPFSALDFRRRIGALDLLRQRVAQGGSVLLSSQSASDLIGVCDTYVVIRDGRYIFAGSRIELEARAGDDGIERELLRMLV